MKRFCCKYLGLPFLAVTTLTLTMMLAGCHHSETSPPSPASVTSTTGSPITQPQKVVIYVVNPQVTGDKDILKAQTITLKHPVSPARDAVEALLKSPHSPMPPGTALRGITVDNSVATLDFSRSPIDETGGESGQSAALTALQQTLGQFPEITQFQVEVKGRSVKNFGEFAADGPIDVIRSASPPQIQGGGL